MKFSFMILTAVALIFPSWSHANNLSNYSCAVAEYEKISFMRDERIIYQNVRAYHIYETNGDRFLWESEPHGWVANGSRIFYQDLKVKALRDCHKFLRSITSG